MTTLRVSAAPEAGSASGDPQDAQNCNSAAFADPHVEQIKPPAACLIKPWIVRPGLDEGKPALDNVRVGLDIRHIVREEE